MEGQQISSLPFEATNKNSEFYTVPQAKCVWWYVEAVPWSRLQDETGRDVLFVRWSCIWLENCLVCILSEDIWHESSKRPQYERKVQFQVNICTGTHNPECVTQSEFWLENLTTFWRLLYCYHSCPLERFSLKTSSSLGGLERPTLRLTAERAKRLRQRPGC